MTTRTIRDHVAPVGDVAGLFAGSPYDILVERLQCARRGGATRVSLITSANDDGTTSVRILDDSLAAQIAACGWTSSDALPLKTCVCNQDTTPTFTISEEWTSALHAIVAEAARYFPLPVVLDNVVQHRVDFLDKALSVTAYGGVRIGVFNETGRHYGHKPTINFHGLTVVHRLPTVAELGNRSTWYARVDIVDCPALQLTLPARKELAATQFLAELAAAISTAIYRTIAGHGSHRLSFASWSEAAALGVLLPEAAEGLVGFSPATADPLFGRTIPTPRLTGEDLILLDDYGAAAEQTLERALTVSQSAIGRRLVRAEAELEGYRWYDRLPALETMRVIVKQGDTVHVLEQESAQPDFGDGHADAIALELSIWQQGALQIHQLNTDLLLLPADEDDADVGAVAIVRDFASGVKPMIPALLGYYLDAAFFLSSGDRDCESWDTQLRAFQTVSRRLALTLVEGADAATRIAIEDAFHDHIAWLVPAGHRLALTFAEGLVDIALVPVPGADTTIRPD